MSNVPAPTPPSSEPPAGTGSAVPQRRARGVAPGFGDAATFASQQQAFITAVADNPNMFIYTGPNLVDRAGIVSRAQYDRTEAYAELAKLGGFRGALLNRLYALGVYGNAKPSRSGLEDKDINAMAQLLDAANAYGRTYDVALDLAQIEFGKQRTGGVRFRPTPKQDLRQVFRNVSSQVLGREMSDAEAEKFVRAYQQMERTEAYGGSRAPDVQLVAQEQIEQAVPEESAAVGALQLATAFDDFVKGMS